ncbi:hypothetical protein KSZ_06660 [Dictyobacter formicarum]|uniref:Uncharacterized protein n=1 Tax=Dictyobacter formicarum TaxID=2778368 RepID=A0ABQ3V9Q3_9CHLR|nr:hypothetical protein KSZ_06660 [Dictyobacter formicarum]
MTLARCSAMEQRDKQVEQHLENTCNTQYVFNGPRVEEDELNDLVRKQMERLGMISP